MRYVLLCAALLPTQLSADEWALAWFDRCTAAIEERLKVQRTALFEDELFDCAATASTVCLYSEQPNTCSIDLGKEVFEIATRSGWTVSKEFAEGLEGLCDGEIGSSRLTPQRDRRSDCYLLGAATAVLEAAISGDLTLEDLK